VNSYIFFRRIRWPIALLTFGVTALLHQWDVLSFDQSWPLYLIVFGVLRLAEGAALSGQSAWSAPAPFSPSQGFTSAPAPTPPPPGTGLVSTTPPGTFQQGAPYPPSVDEES
jgi:hypothetical protein